MKLRQGSGKERQGKARKGKNGERCFFCYVEDETNFRSALETVSVGLKISLDMLLPACKVHKVAEVILLYCMTILTTIIKMLCKAYD